MGDDLQTIITVFQYVGYNGSTLRIKHRLRKADQDLVLFSTIVDDRRYNNIGVRTFVPSIRYFKRARDFNVAKLIREIQSEER